MEKYQEAKKLLSEGSYSDAADLFLSLGSYLDSENQLKAAQQDMSWNDIAPLSASFGVDSAYNLMTGLYRLAHS